MEEVYQIISRAINIDADREIYSKTYNFVRKEVIDGLKKDEYFKALFCDLRLCGSFADNLKISKPNEFDVVMRLQFPFHEHVQIIADSVNKGNIFINLTDVFRCLGENDKMHKFLQQMVNEHKYFLQDKFQRWLEGHFTRFLTSIRNVLNYDGITLRLEHKKHGPAHNIDVFKGMGKELYFSIDFVPGFRFDARLSTSFRKSTTEYWEAIPRLIKNTSNNPSFRTSYTESEREVLRNKNQLKNILRLIKKFRDMNLKLRKLSSYYINTVFLWQADQSDANFWNQPTCVLLNVMFEKLEIALKNQEIQFFWDKKANLLQNLKPEQIKSMYEVVKNARKTIQQSKCSDDVLNLFLTPAEQRKMPPEDNEIVQKEMTQAEQRKMPPEDKEIVQKESNNENLTFLALGVCLLAAFALFRSRREPIEAERE